MKTLTNLGRFIYAIPFLVFGIFHFMNANQMTGMLSGWPAASFFIYLTGVGLILAAISILINKYARIACLLLALLLIIIILSIHVPGLSNEATMQQSMTSLLKDMALAGAALTHAGILKN